MLSAWLWLDETITLISLLGIALIIASIIVINSQHTNWKLNRGHLYALIAALSFGLAFTNDAVIIAQYQSVPAYMVPAFLFPAVIIALYQPRSTKDARFFLSAPLRWIFLACTLIYGVAALSAYTAFQVGGQASFIAPIQQTSLIFTVILSYLFLNERSHLRAKLIGTGLAFIGVVFLVS